MRRCAHESQVPACMVPMGRGNASRTMRRDTSPPDGADEDPLDAVIGQLGDLAELEQRFAALDRRIAETPRRRATGLDGEPIDDEDSPFADLEAVLREQRALVDRDAGADALPGAQEPAIEHDDADERSIGGELDERDEASVEIDSLCQDALDALEEGHCELAREIALGAVRIDDEHPFPMFVLGLVAERQDDLDTARDMAELALRSAGTNPDAIGLRAHIHVRRHEFTQAQELLRFGIANNPDDATLHEGLARVALACGRYDEALQAAAAALRLEPDNAGATAVRTAALEEVEDRGAVLAVLRQGVQLHPEDPYAMVELASAEMEHGNVDRARMLLMRAQRLAPRDHEIGDVRALVEHVHERPLLRPVPALLRWMREFPGGLPGFLVGFVVAALPLGALARTEPDYRVTALGLLGVWGAVALYAWVAPAVLTHRLNQRAARGAFDRLATELRDPCAPLPGVDRLADVTGMQITARARARAVELLELASRRLTSAGEGSAAIGAVASSAASTARGDALDQVARRLRGPQARARGVVLVVPGLLRVLVAAAAAVAVAAPALGDWTGSVLPWHAAALLALAAAWLISITDRAEQRDLEASFSTIRLDVP